MRFDQSDLDQIRDFYPGSERNCLLLERPISPAGTRVWRESEYEAFVKIEDEISHPEKEDEIRI
jgi:hypothetical protein